MNYQKQPYEAPETSCTFLAAENALCQASTGEKFNESVVYSTDWIEED